MFRKKKAIFFLNNSSDFNFHIERSVGTSLIVFNASSITVAVSRFIAEPLIVTATNPRCTVKQF